jgi:hypothetical protein
MSGGPWFFARSSGCPGYSRRGVRAVRAVVAVFGVLVVLVVLLAASPARADRVDDAWKQANDAYLRGDYPAAIAAYENLERLPVVSAELAFNLGNAYFRANRLGPAIWAWERVLTLEPDHEDARYNLDQARRLVAERVHDKLEGADREPGWIRLVNQLSPATETWMFVVLYLAFFASLALFLRARRTATTAEGGADPADAHASPGPTWAVITALLAAATLCAGMLLAGRFLLDRTPFAIVLPDGAPVKEGADTNYRTTFDVHAGLRVRVLEQDHDWVRVRLANGLEGWLPGRSVGRL